MALARCKHRMYGVSTDGRSVGAAGERIKMRKPRMMAALAVPVLVGFAQAVECVLVTS